MKTQEVAAPPPLKPSYLKRLDVVRRVELVAEETPAYASICDTPLRAVELIKPLIANKTREHFAVIMLDARSQALGVMIVSVGTLSASLVHPREVFQPAILANAAAVIVAHNHPSGECTASHEDIEATRRLCRAGELLGIRVLDHVIVSSRPGALGFYSFKDQGRMP